MTTRIIENEYQRKQLLLFIEGHKLPMTARIEAVGSRTARQNRLNRQWMNDIADQLGDNAEYWRGFCKLHFGVAVLKADDSEFSREYDMVVKPLPYAAKLRLMQEPFDFGITRRMSVKQQTKYLDAVHRHFSEQGVALTDPGDLLIHSADGGDHAEAGNPHKERTGEMTKAAKDGHGVQSPASAKFQRAGGF